MEPNLRKRKLQEPKKLAVNSSELRDTKVESETPESRETPQDVPLDFTTGARENSENSKVSISPEKQPLDAIAAFRRLSKITLTPITDATLARPRSFPMEADNLELISLSSGSVVNKARNLVELLKGMRLKEPEIPDSSLPLLKTIKKEIDSEDGEAFPPDLQEPNMDLSSTFDCLYTTSYSSSSSGDGYQFMLEDEASGFQTPPASEESVEAPEKLPDNKNPEKRDMIAQNFYYPFK
ncbi:Hypothetical predicted protein [Cloeon dipterum]|uniref:Uncharacterized protein n=1 Tax=Cloeon dipterum TaxID=197152 RepID=A0A8S1DBC5_9INSE|nr:Hypothetical predicted protein [Cloeon dipterum]